MRNARPSATPWNVTVDDAVAVAITVAVDPLPLALPLAMAEAMAEGTGNAAAAGAGGPPPVLLNNPELLPQHGGFPSHLLNTLIAMSIISRYTICVFIPLMNGRRHSRTQGSCAILFASVPPCRKRSSKRSSGKRGVEYLVKWKGFT